MGKKTVGYMVLDDERWPLKYDDRTKSRVMWFAYGRMAATLFPSRAAARRAIANTIRFAREHGYQWGENYHVVRVESA